VTGVEMTLWCDEAATTPVSAAAQRHDARTRLYLRVLDEDVEGVGEVAPQPYALNGDPGLDDVLDEVCSFVAPLVRDVAQREGALPDWTRVARFAGSRPASPVATALVEMAILDRELRATGRAPGDLWAREHATAVQATVSLLDETDWVVNPDVARLRVKTSPGALGERARANLRATALPVLLDFNCSATTPSEVLDQVARVAALCDLVSVEQPFGPGNLADHAALARVLDVALSLDEGVRAPRDLEKIVQYAAATMVCVKPARVGGLANAHTMVHRARALGLRPYLGGFFESPYARTVHRALADHCVEEPSDLAPVTRLDAVAPEVEEAPGSFGLRPSHAVFAHGRLLATL
jgi:o-succinylbenzoate synthase